MTAGSQQSLDFVFRRALLVEIDELISRKAVIRPGASDVGQNHFFAQAGFDQIDDILNTGREARRRLGRAMDGRRLQNQAGCQTGNCDVMLQFKQASPFCAFHNPLLTRIRPPGYPVNC